MNNEPEPWHARNCSHLAGMSDWRLNRWGEEYRVCLDCKGIEMRKAGA